MRAFSHVIHSIFPKGLLLPLTKDRQTTRDLFVKSINKFDAKKWHLKSSSNESNLGFEPIYGEVCHDDVFFTTKSGDDLSIYEQCFNFKIERSSNCKQFFVNSCDRPFFFHKICNL